eukprot:2496102-Alexandrium_andersonii.AAC.1
MLALGGAGLCIVALRSIDTAGRSSRGLLGGGWWSARRCSKWHLCIARGRLGSFIVSVTVSVAECSVRIKKCARVGARARARVHARARARAHARARARVLARARVHAYVCALAPARVHVRVRAGARA